MPRFPLIVMCLALLLVLGACNEEVPAAPTAEVETADEAAVEEAVDEAAVEEVVEEEVHWSYEGEGGPEHWGSLESDYATCGEGRKQSPVDIPADAPLNPNDLVYAYEGSGFEIENNGHAIQADYVSGGTAEIGDAPYTLKQFHFHSPSEHTLAGQHAAMEMHLVHEGAGGKLAVIGVMLVEGAENPAFAPVWDNMPAEEGPAMPVAGAILNADDLLPEDRSYNAYEGSLTTPKCDEGVQWIVLSTPVEISADQLAAFRAIHDGTNRPTQPMYNRVFELGLSGEAATGFPDPEVSYQLQTELTESDNMCLEGQGGEAAGSGALLDGAGFMDGCQTVTGQMWTFVPEVDGYYRLQNAIGEEGEFCAEGNRLSDESVLGGALVMMPCDDVSGQLWKLLDAGDGYYQLQTQFLEADNKCLESQGGAAPDSGAVLDGAAFMNDCQAVAGQLWRLVPQQ